MSNEGSSKPQGLRLRTISELPGKAQVPRLHMFGLSVICSGGCCSLESVAGIAGQVSHPHFVGFLGAGDGKHACDVVKLEWLATSAGHIRGLQTTSFRVHLDKAQPSARTTASWQVSWKDSFQEEVWLHSPHKFVRPGTFVMLGCGVLRLSGDLHASEGFHGPAGRSDKTGSLLYVGWNSTTAASRSARNPVPFPLL